MNTMEHYGYDTNQDTWLDRIPVSTPPSNPDHGHGHSHSHGHSHFAPSNYAHAHSNDSVQPTTSFTISAEDNWAASHFIRDIFAGRIPRSAFLPENWSQSSSAYPLQVVEESGLGVGLLPSQQPPLYFGIPAAVDETLSMELPHEETKPTTHSTDTPTGCQRRARTPSARFHPASTPQRLPRGMRKTWGPAAAAAPTLAAVLAELRREGIDDAVLAIVRDLFGGPSGLSVAALMRGLSKDESRRYLNGAKGQAYRALLSQSQSQQQQQQLGPGPGPALDERYQCRLCHQGPNAMSWKHPRDVVRHLRRDHFGLGDACSTCQHVVYTTGEMTNHRCKSNPNL